MNPNILWICNKCRRAKEERRSSQKASIIDSTTTSDIVELKTEMERTKVMLNELSHKFDSLNASSFQSEQSGDSQHVLNSSLFTSTRHDHSIQNQGHSNTSLFVSNIAPDVTDEEFKRMVEETVGPGNIVSFKCLVPAWKEKSSLDYISYKVVVNVKHGTASNAVNWPNGVRCREFVNRLNESWRPAHRIV